MAPRPLESREALIARLRAADLTRGHLAFGGQHDSHAVTRDPDGWHIRRLILDPARVEAHRAAHRSFTPEHADLLKEPGPDIVLAAPTLDDLIDALRARPWPLP